MREARANDYGYYRYNFLLRELGEPRKREEIFEARSLVRYVTQIKVPVFIAHGENDRTVDSSQSHRLVKDLAKSGVPHETMFVRGERHGFDYDKNRIKLYERIESFLKKNI